MGKTLLVVSDDELKKLNDETGMNFHIVNTPKGLLAILGDGAALPYFSDPHHYDITDLLAGNTLPQERSTATTLSVRACFSSRAAALQALQAANVSPHYTGSTGAFPLIASYVLRRKAIFYRYLSGSSDPRFVGGALKANTYLTARRDSKYVNTGFGAVGRFALPLPLPACKVVHYEIPKGTTIKVGTVAPAFGQAGGGVEIQIVQIPSAKSTPQVGGGNVPEY